MLSADIAGRLGRIGLSRSRPVSVSDGSRGGGNTSLLSGSISASSTADIGRQSLIFYGLVLAGLVAFHYWTRGHQL